FNDPRVVGARATATERRLGATPATLADWAWWNPLHNRDLLRHYHSVTVVREGTVSRPERKLAAILAADVVGYSRLMAADETGTLFQLKTLRAEVIDPKVAQFKGRLVGMAGDSLLVEFPSAVDAVQCAVETQERIASRNADLPENRR